MKPKRTMAIAILAVAIMIGSALMPLVSDTDIGQTSADTTYSPSISTLNELSDGMGSSDLSGSLMGIAPELMSSFSVDAMNLADLFSDGIAFVPVANDTDYNSMVLWDGSSVSEKSVVGLYDGTEVQLLAEDSGTIGAGATLVIFPVGQKTDLSFTITSPEEEQSGICLADGSFIDIFGMKFKVVSNSIHSESFHLFDVFGSVTVESGINGEAFSAYIELKAQSEFYCFEDYMFINNGLTDQTAADASVKITAAKIAAADGTVTVNNPDVKIKSLYPVKLESGAMDISVSSDMVNFKNVPATSDKGSTEFSFSAIRSDLKGVDDKEMNVPLEISKLVIPQGKLSVETGAKAVTVSAVEDVEITRALTLTFDDTQGQITVDSLKAAFTEITGLKVNAGKLEAVFCEDPANAKETESFKCSGDLKISASKLVFSILPNDPFTVSSLSITATNLVENEVNEIIVPVGEPSEASPSTSVTMDSLNVSGKVSNKQLLKNYIFSFSVSVTAVSYTGGSEDPSLSIGQISVSISVKYDGQDRTVSADITGAAITLHIEELLDDVSVNAKGTVEGLTFSCKIPFKTMGIGTALGIDSNIDMSVSGKKLSFDTIKDNIEVSGDSASVESSTKIESAPYIEKITALMTGFSIKGPELTAESITGSLKDYGESEKNFSIVKKGNSNPKVSFDEEMFTIISGRAEFSSGSIPSILHIKGDAVFVADGLSALGVIMDKGAILSGTVVLDTKEATEDMTEMCIKYDNQILVKAAVDVEDPGYCVIFDIGTLGGGKMISYEGRTIPAWKSEYGTSWKVASDGSSATFDTGTGASFRFVCDYKSYSFQYEGGSPESKTYGEKVVLKEGSAMSGKAFAGWSDGSGKTYPAGSEYTMPARNVVLSPTYVDVAPNTSIIGPSVLVVSESEAVLVSKDSIKGVAEGGSLRIGVEGANINMGKDTLDSLIVGSGSADTGLVFSAKKAVNIDDPVKKRIVGDNTMYSIELTTDKGAEFTYTGEQNFQVTLQVEAKAGVDHYNVSYLSKDNEKHSVGVINTVTQNSKYNLVTFECNHCSDYIIEPVYKEESDPSAALYIGLGVLAVLAVALAVVGLRKH